MNNRSTLKFLKSINMSISNNNFDNIQFQLQNAPIFKQGKICRKKIHFELHLIEIFELRIIASIQEKKQFFVETREENNLPSGRQYREIYVFRFFYHPRFLRKTEGTKWPINLKSYNVIQRCGALSYMPFWCIVIRTKDFQLFP